MKIFGENIFCNTEARKLQYLFGFVCAFYDCELERKIGQFIKMRDLAAHSRMSWNESADIFSHLTILLYLCILCRVGYTAEESKKIVGLSD